MGEVVRRATSWQGPVAANKTEDNSGGGGGVGGKGVGHNLSMLDS